MTDKNDTLIVIDEDDQEIEMKILLTFNSEDLEKDYVLFYKTDNDEEIFAASYDDEGNLFPIEAESDEWQMINEVLEAYINEETEDEEKEE